MKKVFEECSLLLVVFLFPLAAILLIPGDGSISFLPILPIIIIGGIATMRLSMKKQLCFEQWMKRSPAVTVPLAITLCAAIICGEMRIIISTKLPELAIPHYDVTDEEIDQVLAD